MSFCGIVCPALKPRFPIVSIRHSLDSWLWLSTSMSLQVPRLLLMVSHDCVLVAISILVTDLRLFLPISCDHSTTSGTTTLCEHLMCPVCVESVSLCVAVSVHGSMVLFTGGVLLQTPEKVGANIMFAPTRNNKGTGLTHLGTRETHPYHGAVAMRDSWEAGVQAGQMPPIGKYIRQIPGSVERLQRT